MGEFSSKLPFFLILHLAALLSFGNARDTIAPGQSINDNQTLVSAEGSFELGFFSPGRSKNRYLGIWYNNISVQTVVWVANRQSPLSDSTGVLKIASNGSLILANGNGTVFWSTPATSARSPVAQLLDNGNFAVLDAANNVTGTYAWQGFDHPTDTLLPGMKIGWDLRIGLNRNITAWKNSDDPAKGNISITMDTHGVPELFVMAGSVRLSRSGPWVGHRFSGNTEMKTNDMFSFSFVANSDEIYYKFDILNHAIKSKLTVNKPGTVNNPGTVQLLVWIDQSNSWEVLWFSPKDQCDIISFCGPYGLCNTNDSPICNCLQGFKPKSSSDQVWSLRDIGCVRKTPLDCQNGNDGFVTVNGAKLPDTSNAVVNVSLSLGDCRIACLSNCSCTGYASSDGGGGNGCFMWFSELTDLRVYMTGGQDLYVRMAAADLDHAKQMILWIVVPVAVAVVILLLGLFMCLSRLRNQTHKGMKEAKHEILELEMDTDEEGEKGLEFSLFSFATIEAATGNFLVGNKLGKGGFGPVYKGKLPDGRDIAVKRLSRSSGQGVQEFKNEIRLVAKLQHTNLVRLLGYCIQGEEKLLIYEYMPNNSLESYLFDASRGAQLDWRKRFHIIERIAQGVLYLHKYSRLRIIHRDLKASNILLDSEMNPKISDFGMARIFGQNESRANTNRVVGTYGYMSPEYAIHGLFSMKSDVFSFGVLLMEIVTGKRNSCFQSSSPSPNLLGYAWEQWQRDKWLELIDPLLGDTCTLSEVSRCIQVALLCVQESAADRPTMSDVISMLHTETSALPTPKQPAFSFGTSLVEEELPSTRQQIYSANGLTNSNEGR